MEDYLKIAISAAELGGEVLTKYWGKLTEVFEKELPGDLVTVADKESEEKIIAFLQRRCPGHSILSEETGMHKVEGSEYEWVIDPLDGTTNYTHQFPMSAVSVGLLYRGKPIVGAICHPIVQDLYYAAEGLGAFLNGKRIAVSKVKELRSSLLATGFAYDRRETKDNNFAEFSELTLASQGVRRLGAASLDLAYVAAGRLDGYWERGLKPWDMAAGIVLVREAGGVVSAYDQGAVDLYSGFVLATNGVIHQAMSQELLAIRRKVTRN
jgi:myo-inositol-1(or 4)-monophosphatase